LAKIVSTIIRDPAENASLREAAIAAYGRFWHPVGVPIEPGILVEVLRNAGEAPALRESAVGSLKELGTYASSAFGDLLAVLNDGREDISLRASIPPALTGIDRRAVGLADMLIAMLKNNREMTELRIAACLALVHIDFKDVHLAQHALDEVVRTTQDPDLRREAERSKELCLKRLNSLPDTVGVEGRERRLGLWPKRLSFSARIGTKQIPGRLSASFPSFKPRDALGQPALNAVGRDALGFRVHEFDKPPEIAESGFQIDSAGQIIADAIARQLGAWGFEVMLSSKEERFEIDEADSDSGPIGRRAVAEVSGRVRFDVDHVPGKDGDQTTARLDVKVVIVGTMGGQTTALFDRSFQEVETITAQRRAGRAERGQKAASIVLGRFVEKLLGDPELERKLVAFGRASGR
jgi:hypothetical protein